MVKQFGVSKSTITFKIKIVKLINKYPKVKNSSLSLNTFCIQFLAILSKSSPTAAIFLRVLSNPFSNLYADFAADKYGRAQILRQD